MGVGSGWYCAYLPCQGLVSAIFQSWMQALGEGDISEASQWGDRHLGFDPSSLGHQRVPLGLGRGRGPEGKLGSLSLSTPSGWVLTWLRKGMEKVVPQPVLSSGPAQTTAAGLEGPTQVLVGVGAEVVLVGKGRVGGHWVWALCPHVSVCPGRQEHRSLGNAAMGAQVRPGGRMAFWGWD